MLTSLDTINFGQLKLLNIVGTSISYIDTTALVKLETLYVANSKLDSLDTSNLKQLKGLVIDGTNIRQLDVTALIKLE